MRIIEFSFSYKKILVISLQCWEKFIAAISIPLLKIEFKALTTEFNFLSFL